MTTDDLGELPDPDAEDCGCDDTPLEEQLSPQDAETLAWVSATVGESQGSVETAVQSLADDALGELGAISQSLGTTTSELTGQIELELDTQLGKLDGTMTRWANDIDRAYNASADELYHSGIALPYSVGQMQADMATDPVAMLAARIPAVGQILGGSYAEYQSPASAPTATPETTPPVDYPSETTPSLPAPGSYSVDVVSPLTPPTTPSFLTTPPVVPPPPPPPISLTGSVSTLPPVLPPTAPPTVSTVTVPASGAGECGSVTVNVTVPPPSVFVQAAPCCPPGSEKDTSTAPDGSENTLPPPVDYVSAQVPPTAPPTPPKTTPLPLPNDELVRFGSVSAGPIDKPAQVDWNTLTVCGPLATWAASIASVGTSLATDAQAKTFKAGTAILSQAFVQTYESLDSDARNSPALKKLAEWGKDAADGLFDMTAGGKALDSFFGLVRPDGVRNLGAALLYSGRLGAANLIEQRTGVPLSYLMQSEQYSLQWSNPMYLPGQRDVDAAYLTNTIDSTAWECWTRALGNLPEPARRVMLAQQVKPGVVELVQLRFRGLIGPAEYQNRMRELGILDAQYAREWEKLFEQLPTQSELLRYMVRDSADESVAKLYGYDAGFTEKFTGRIEEWAKAQGITGDIFKYFWRAHWEIPSNTALYEMFHRLRPDRAERLDWEKGNPRAAGESDAEYRLRGPVSVSLDDIRQALQVNDVAPAWVDRLLAVSYHPITRTDATRAYLIGAFTTAQLRSALLDNGYSPENAELLIRFYRLQKRSRQANASGGWTIRKITKYFSQGLITEADAIQRLRKLVDEEAEINSIMEQTRQVVEADDKRRALGVLRKGYLVGEIDEFQLDVELRPLGLDVEQKNRIAASWKRDKLGKYKQPSTEQIVSWMQKRLITAPETLIRLTRLGYTERDAERIIEVAIMKGESKGDLSAEEAGGVFEAAIKTARQARMETNTRLASRWNELAKELVRVRNELNKRQKDAGQPELTPLTIP